MMMTIGGDAHKRTHTFVAADPTGRQIAQRTVAATTEGHLEARTWAAQWPQRQWALEDCRQVTRRLERDLKLLVDHREDLVAERVRTQCRLHWHLHELMPEHHVGLRRLNRFRVLRDLRDRIAPLDGPVADISRELIDRVWELTVRINALFREISSLVGELAPTLLMLEGCGPMSAAKIVAEVAGVDRFRSRSAFARWNGTAPIPVWSAQERFRLNRGGNRQVNAAIHRIAITQWREPSRGQDYIQSRLDRGDTKRCAIRALKRRLSDEVYRRLREDAAARSADLPADAAIAEAA